MAPLYYFWPLTAKRKLQQIDKEKVLNLLPLSLPRPSSLLPRQSPPWPPGASYRSPRTRSACQTRCPTWGSRWTGNPGTARSRGRERRRGGAGRCSGRSWRVVVGSGWGLHWHGKRGSLRGKGESLSFSFSVDIVPCCLARVGRTLRS